ncbi:MAG: 1,4-alpha-glucan branching protein GlgB [Planctomycetes bacterium]|nr:1,4-alpha-glucan branching protein GlgB [Planctomycetota bacterium]
MNDTPYREQPNVRYDVGLLTDYDAYLFNQGSHFDIWRKLGSHVMSEGGVSGVYFAVWAPSARQVSVIGDFNQWSKDRHPLRPRGSSGIWEGFIPGLDRGTLYKYHIQGRHSDFRVDKSDPVGVMHEVPPKTATVAWDLDYEWRDEAWMAIRGERNGLHSPMSIYEVHLGSWRRMEAEGWRSLHYRELAYELADHVKRCGFTHVEFLPVMEHPFFGSWGYQTTGYFAPSSRYGTPQDFKHLVDHLHQQGIGVILDWVPSHFPGDEHGLVYFDGTHLYEHEDPRQGFHPDWNSYIFNYGRNEVRSFLLSNALYWIEEFHVDGLRVDAVASMLYLDYSRKEGEWIPNKYGGRDNLEAIDFLRRFNEEIFKRHPDVQTIAEESTAWPMVSRPTYVGGLGFGMKWDMGWMHDTLRYMSDDPIYRKYHHGELTFRMIYAFNENFVMPLSHDEVVYGKGSLLNKMPGDDWQKFANLRLLYAYMTGMPGKKLLFMGGEIGQWDEWRHDGSVEWDLLQQPKHSGLLRWVGALNNFYSGEPALHELDCDPAGFEWVESHDGERSVIAFLRKAQTRDDIILVVCNFTPVPWESYRVGVPREGHWREILNSDAQEHGGSGVGNLGGVEASPISAQGRPYSVSLKVPPLGAVFLKSER